ncbi:hypothetical protein J5N97_017854 [Dioscorea zingiberensis]|uniref:HMA domain-containing protein n=1 Tax=Dioscorea zingiberensis TaxID=325984 RepID=A0A9D5HGR3_9LILI|nr:hypothetical protein J5N97_017854 [Dioscorea zingiberensis]
MAKKKNKSQEPKQPGEQQKDDGEKKPKKEDDMHCSGCAKKFHRSIKGFQGVDGVVAEPVTGRMTVDRGDPQPAGQEGEEGSESDNGLGRREAPVRCRREEPQTL